MFFRDSLLVKKMIFIAPDFRNIFKLINIRVIEVVLENIIVGSGNRRNPRGTSNLQKYDFIPNQYIGS